MKKRFFISYIFNNIINLVGLKYYLKILGWLSLFLTSPLILFKPINTSPLMIVLKGYIKNHNFPKTRIKDSIFVDHCFTEFNLYVFHGETS